MRILLVEDDPKISAIVRQALQEEAYAVDVAFDGDRAEELAFVNKYDAIVLDLMLPGRPGLEVCKALREEGSTAPVLILTARDTLEDRVAGLDSGADDYLVKPFHVEELLARVRALLRRQAPVKSTRLTVGDLAVDTAAHSVTRGGERIELTQTEYAILEHMARHAGAVIGRGELMESVWDENYEGLSNIVDVYMRRLRTKIDEGSPVRLIETIRGAGYRLRVPEHASVSA
ncbi:MAG: DNA-binding response regulator [Chloroflexi bacterium]|nr:MAG: DNA-binding response regulator [Chloroflexota bacterium]